MYIYIYVYRRPAAAWDRSPVACARSFTTDNCEPGLGICIYIYVRIYIYTYSHIYTYIYIYIFLYERDKAFFFEKGILCHIYIYSYISTRIYSFVTVFGTPAFVSLRHHRSKYYVLRNQHLIVQCYPNRLFYVPSRNLQLN